MKLLRIVFLLFITNNCHISTSQISGVVKDIKGNPVEYASIKFKNSYEGTVTDSLGYFIITKPLADTLVIYHLSYGSKEIILPSDGIEVFLERDIRKLPEIKVSGSYGFKMFSEYTQNTYNKLREKYLSRSYWSGFDIVNNDTICHVDIDFDVEQINLKKQGKEANMQLKKIQERIVYKVDNYKEDWGLNYRVRVQPPENNFLIYKDFVDEYVCLIQEDSIRIKLYFYPKSSVAKGYNNIEIAIWKNNLCIDYIASCTAESKQEYTGKGTVWGNDVDRQDVMIFLKYNYVEDYCYMSYFEMGNTFQYIADEREICRTHLSKYQVYNQDVPKGKKRKGKNILSYNILEKATNSYQTKFWESEQFKFEDSYDYDALRMAGVK